MTTENDVASPYKPTPLMGLVILVAITVAVLIYVEIAGRLGIVPVYAGFIFSLYFGTFKGGALSELPAAVLGALGGILLGAGLHVLPALWGTAGLCVELFLIAVSVYLLIMGWLGLLVNAGFMLLLTIATIPSIQGDGRFIGMGGAVLLVAAIMAGATLAGQWIGARKARQASTPGS